MAALNLTWFMARLEGFEPTTYGLEVRSSIHLSYRRLIAKYTTSLSFGQDQFLKRPRQSPKCPKIVKYFIIQ